MSIMFEVDAIIRKVGPKKWCLYAKKKDPKTGKRRRLGCAPSLEGVKKRERQVQFFKRQGTADLLADILTDLEETLSRKMGQTSPGRRIPGR